MTSIEWLIEEIIKNALFKESVTLTNIDHLQYEAEQMHKQEIIMGYHNGYSDAIFSEPKEYNPEKYYHKTYADKKS